MSVFRVSLAVAAVCTVFGVMPSGVAHASSQAANLPTAVARVARAHELPLDNLSVRVHEAHTGRLVVDHNPDVVRNPASVMKLVTTLAGLELLGPDFTWRTDFVVAAPPQGGRLKGALHLVGRGDPRLYTENLWRALMELRNRGLEVIEGDLVIDQNAFALTQTDPGAFDGQPHRAYNAIPGALVVNFNAVRFNLYPDRAAGVVRVATDPPTERLKLINRLKLAKGRCRGRHHRIGMRIAATEAPPRVTFTGTYPASCGSRSILRSIEPDERHVFGVFKALWHSLGGRIEGNVRLGQPPKDARRFSRIISVPLSEAIDGMNKYSNNIMTRQLFLTLALELAGQPGTLENGRRVVAQWMRKKGVDTTGFFIDNGAGLSRDARASARQLSALLLDAYHGPLMPEFIASLPLSAVDGTLRRRFKKSALAGRVYLKTGLIKHVRAGAGYLWSKSAKVYSVVILQNHTGVHSGVGTAVQDALLEWIHTVEP